ncbi:CPBP family intramembrane glutamic endopeptidase [Vaginisenegalia massiliensis]|uniref:CPBP family intramembrane glutamic endopeptidase n=1 Tax=Vaginisenegalia massiliensis TaxID=2058294 RepID=UPI000F51EEC1|nr:CPBP family intramembrane glutamic endopeptidase [Vaginisenegalia massiliensis]
MEKIKIKKYLLVVFGISWFMQGLALVCHNPTLFQIILAIMMWIPGLCVLILKEPINKLGWKLKFKQNWKYIIMAICGPVSLGILGVLIFGLIFPDSLDFSEKHLLTILGKNHVQTLLKKGMSVQNFIVVMIIQSTFLAPLINLLFALGEEIGWRGYLYRRLNQLFNQNTARLIGGLIWGIWHWPIIIFAGYEYGLEYWGSPFLGPIVFCLFTISAGYLLDYLYIKTHSIWVPSLGHGAINAFVFPLNFLSPLKTHLRIWGPLPMGLISMLPYILVTIWLASKSGFSDTKSVQRQKAS